MRAAVHDALRVTRIIEISKLIQTYDYVIGQSVVIYSQPEMKCSWKNCEFFYLNNEMLLYLTINLKNTSFTDDLLTESPRFDGC
jgi:hypothetical protein